MSFTDDDWTGSLVDRLNELARENASLFSECHNGQEASLLIQKIHGHFNELRAENGNLKQELSTGREIHNAACSELLNLRAENKRYREALQWYEQMAQTTEIEYDCGKVAREALSPVKSPESSPSTAR